MKTYIGQLSGIRLNNGACYIAELPENAPRGDTEDAPDQSDLRLFENGVELGPAHCKHNEICEFGAGRFSHWGSGIWFSSSDGSDPRTNGRTYQALFVGRNKHNELTHTTTSVAASPALTTEQLERAGELVFPKDRLLQLHTIRADAGLRFSALLPPNIPRGDAIDRPPQSSLRLFEGEIELGPAHAQHVDIGDLGGGRYSHWGNAIIFSTSDGSDPRTNGRTYTVLYNEHDSQSRAVLRDCLNVDFGPLDISMRYVWAERAFNAIVPYERLADFGRIMFGDEEFLADYERFDTQNYRSFDRKFALRELLKLVLPLKGELAECGVFRGASAFMMAKAIARDAPGKRLHIFDSFSGLSDPRPELDGTHWRSGSMSAGLAEVQGNLEDYHELLVFHPGWIPERFADVADKNFCFVHVDVDLFEPTRDSFAFFGPRMVPGGIIVCDDYGFGICPGARKAMDEYAASTELPIIHLPTGQGVMFFGRRGDGE